MKGRTWNLKWVLQVSGVILAAFFLFVQSFTFYVVGKHMLQNRIEDLNQRNRLQLTHKLNLAFNDMVRFSSSLSGRQDLKLNLQVLANPDTNSLEQRDVRRKIQNSLLFSATFYNYIARLDLEWKGQSNFLAAGGMEATELANKQYQASTK